MSGRYKIKFSQKSVSLDFGCSTRGKIFSNNEKMAVDEAVISSVEIGG